MFKEQIAILTLSGSGETKEHAFNQIFSQVKREVAKQCQDMILQIEPQDVDIISAVHTISTERFLGIFWPRQRDRYEIKLHLTVRIRSVSLDGVRFDEREVKLSRLEQLIQMR